MSLFSDLEHQLSVDLDFVYSDRTQIIRQTEGEYLASTEIAPLPADLVVGIVDINPKVMEIQDKSQYDGFQPDVAGKRIHVSYDISLFADQAAWPVKNDLIEDLDRLGAPKYKVVTAQDDGMGRLLCICVPQ